MKSFLSRIFVPSQYREDPRYGEDFATRVIVAVSLRLALLLLFPLLVAISFAVHEARERDEAINASRAQISYSACLLTNRRHERTVRRLGSLTRSRKRALVEERRTATPVRRVAIEAELLRIPATRASTIFLIDALVPKINCERQARSRFGFTPKNGR